MSSQIASTERGHRTDQQLDQPEGQTGFLRCQTPGGLIISSEGDHHTHVAEPVVRAEQSWVSLFDQHPEHKISALNGTPRRKKQPLSFLQWKSQPKAEDNLQFQWTDTSHVKCNPCGDNDDKTTYSDVLLRSLGKPQCGPLQP
jgi:hypothetical protein